MHSLNYDVQSQRTKTCRRLQSIHLQITQLHALYLKVNKITWFVGKSETYQGSYRYRKCALAQTNSSIWSRSTKITFNNRYSNGPFTFFLSKNYLNYDPLDVIFTKDESSLSLGYIVFIFSSSYTCTYRRPKYSKVWPI